MVKPSVPSGALRVMVGGGIGAGKGVVARIFSRNGFALISADEAGHEILEPGGRAHAAVAARWPSVMVDGRIDRARLAAIVFTDTAQLEELEALTHAGIIESIEEQAASLAGPVVVEVPVLLPIDGGGWKRVFVDADEELRIERAVARGGEEADVRRRAAAQVDREAWLDWADGVIVNEGTVEDLGEQVSALLERFGLVSPGSAGGDA